MDELLKNWIRVAEFPEYGVTPCGQIIRVRADQGRTKIGKVLKPSYSHKGYAVVNLTRDGKQRTRQVHTLVAAAYHGPRPEGLQVNHKNGIKADNRKDNLEYATPSANCQHAWDTGLHGPRLLSPEQVQECIQLSATYTQRELARMYGVCQRTINVAVRGLNGYALAS